MSLGWTVPSLILSAFEKASTIWPPPHVNLWSEQNERGIEDDDGDGIVIIIIIIILFHTKNKTCLFLLCMCACFEVLYCLDTKFGVKLQVFQDLASNIVALLDSSE